MSQPERQPRSKVKSAVVGVAISIAAATGVVGLLHTSVGKPLLAKAGGCPANNAPPQGVEDAQKRAIRLTRGDTPAPARMALGFQLDKTTLNDVQSWAKARGVTCKATREDTTISCVDIPAEALPATFARARIDELEMSFRVGDKTLLGLSTWRWHLPEDTAARELDSVVAGLRGSLGSPMTDEGDRARLGREPYAGAIVKYNFKDYLCTISGMNLPEKGITLHESYVTGVVD
ncbi:MAG: hypothetical protein IPQ09_07615 [Myxococcales bacterium]|jgi:hypothetical protein|nr:hypothetical protein [Myxococcales bacterium]HQY61331.1 hypothetical protein [Polyangiaceae bacterium]